MWHSESTLRSAAPLVPDDEVARVTEQALVLAGGACVELHPPKITAADIVLRGAVIEQIGGEIAEGLPRVDVSGCLVMPAFTVAHTHLYMALAAGMPPPARAPRSFAEHLQSVWWNVDKALDDELVQTSALVAAAQAAKAGAACVVDLHSSPRAIDGSLDRIAAALDEVGLRGILAYETSDRDGRARRDAAMKENRRFLQKVARGETQHRACVGAHALMSLNDDTLEALRDLANEMRVGMHLQLAEDGSDALDAERNRRTRLAQRLRLLEAVRRGSILAQCNELPPELVAGIADAEAFVVTSPRSNMRQGLSTFPGSGPHVALGTDGLDGDVLAEARAYALRHAESRDGLAAETGSRIVAGQILSAHLFGDRIAPRLLPGARADLVVLDYVPFTPLTASNLVEHLVRNVSAGHVRHTISGGRFIVRDRALVTVDEAALVQRARLAAAQLWERTQS
ncbi:MAG: amidohydrolase family protein [Labilithrix sp.]|nr:amidohydrolase family protein [Labilithrix sp.]MCW5812243.1 amidohydrolase family protein [Labilithrix sp.]